MNSLVDTYKDRYKDPRRGQVIGVNYGPSGQAIESELGLGSGKRIAGEALGLGIDGLRNLVYREKPRQLTPGELNDFFGGMDPGDLFGGEETGIDIGPYNPETDDPGLELLLASAEHPKFRLVLIARSEQDLKVCGLSA